LSNSDEVVEHLVSVMDTSAQAIANLKLSNVRMTKPYRQRILRILPTIYSQTVRSLSFRPTKSETLVGLFNQPEVSRILPLSDRGTPALFFSNNRAKTMCAERRLLDAPPRFKEPSASPTRSRFVKLRWTLGIAAMTLKANKFGAQNQNLTNSVAEF
jgi:CpeT/CpcT family (DUF1001)